jgi:hypothetical protein
MVCSLYWVAMRSKLIYKTIGVDCKNIFITNMLEPWQWLATRKMTRFEELLEFFS